MLRIDGRKLVFVDTETTHIDPLIARPWEIALIERWPDGRERSTLIHVLDVDFEDASDEALAVGRFAERFRREDAWLLSEEIAALWVARRLATDSASQGAPVLIGSAVQGYDSTVLARMLARHRRALVRAGVAAAPGWSHHSIDLVTLAQGRALAEGVAGLGDGSYGLSEALGVPRPAAEVAHTAMGDALWARAWWDALTGASS